MARPIFRTTSRFDKKLGRMVDITPPSKRKMISHIQRTKPKIKPGRLLRRGAARWPCVSENAGVMPDQVDEARAAVKRLGLQGVEYLDDGQVVWHGPEARKQHLKSIGAHDKNGYY